MSIAAQVQELRKLTDAMGGVADCLEKIDKRAGQLQDLNLELHAMNSRLLALKSKFESKSPGETEMLKLLDEQRAIVARKIELNPVHDELVSECPKLLDQLIEYLVVIFNHPNARAHLQNYRDVALKLRSDLSAEQWLRLVAGCPDAHLN